MAFVCNLGLKFSEVAEVNASRLALRNPDGQFITYAELEHLSNRIARLLLERGLKRGDVVAIFHDKSSAGFAAMLACLKIGLIYTNLDPHSPWERLRKILLTCEPKAIINSYTELTHAQSIEKESARLIHLRERKLEEEWEKLAPDRLSKLSEVTGADPAYLMFTSGSTGIPKGAVMSHANVLNFIAWAQDRFEITSKDILSNANPIYFDNSVFDFYASLFSGASMVPISAERVRDPRLLVKTINEAHCTVWFSVPSLLVYLLTTRALSATDFSSMRKIIFGGEGFPKPKLKKLYDLFGERAHLENVYGPTECTCICSAHRVGPSDFADMKALTTLGFLADNFDYEILGESADGNSGELFLRGPNVGLGYYRDQERTAQVFIQNPHHERFADRGYRTGDLVRRDEAGHLHFVGRADFQIKHMGYRIELEEIEAAVAVISEVKECAVIYRRLGEGMGEIVAFAALSAPKEPEKLIQEVAEIVPPYMVPKRVKVVENLPKNANGKIDRIALQALATNSP